jgi:hypothetical protein
LRGLVVKLHNHTGSLFCVSMLVSLILGGPNQLFFFCSFFV